MVSLDTLEIKAQEKKKKSHLKLLSMLPLLSIKRAFRQQETETTQLVLLVKEGKQHFPRPWYFFSITSSNSMILLITFPKIKPKLPNLRHYRTQESHGRLDGKVSRRSLKPLS